jgi:predicted transcriptional regulator
MSKSYRVGTLDDFKRWTMQVVRDPRAARGMPKRWYDSEDTARAARKGKAKRQPSYGSKDLRSPESVVRLITDNLAVLHAIDRSTPASIRELAALTGRSDSNVHRTLKKLEQAGLIAFRAGPRRTRQPVLTARKVKLEIDLSHGP